MRMSWMVALLAACGGGSNGDVPGDGPVELPGKRGLVIITQSTFIDMDTTSHIAEFRDGDNATGRREDGPCTIATGINAIVAPKVSFGSIAFAGAGETITITPEVDGDYNGELTQGFLYTGGDAIAIASSGAPDSFTADVTFPSAITVSDVPDPLTTPLVIDRAAGFSATVAGDAPVLLTLFQGGEVGVFISCRFSGVTTVTVPASTLSDLMPGTDSSTQVSLTIGGDGSKTIVAGDYGIEILVVSAGYVNQGRVQ